MFNGIPMVGKRELTDCVMRIMNEADAQVEGALVDGDMVDVASYVEGLLPAAWRRAVVCFPLSWFEGRVFPDRTVHGDGPRGVGYVVLPEDFLALWSFRMRGWRTSCRTALEMTPAVERRQANRYTRGTPERPVCVLGTAPVSEDGLPARVLWYFSLPAAADAAGHVVEEALYVGALDGGEEEIPIAAAGYEALCYLCAATVLTSFEKYDAAGAMEAKAMGMIG